MQGMDRRSFLRGAASAAVLAGGNGLNFARRHQDDAMLDDLSQRCFRYFWDASDPETGICRDLIHGNPADDIRKGDEPRGSTGVTGFCLTALCIGADHGWITREPAKDRVRRALRSYTNGKVEAIHGWFYHFNDVHTGQRWKNSEVSTSDSIWLLAGALTCRQFFQEDAEIADLASQLYSRYDFQWMTNGDGKLLSHGWRPEGFIKFRYDKYCQLAAMVLLGIGAPQHALPPEAWYAWERNPNSYDSFHYIGTSLLWTYQYPFAWFDFRGRRETRGTHVDWFENSQTATRAHRAWCYQELAKTFPDYTPQIWGITSSSGPTGYRAWGGPPRQGKIDGSVVPCAAGGSLMLTPDICIAALHAMKDKFGGQIWGKYGLADAFNPVAGWVSTDTLGLDVGMILLSAENRRSGSVWQWFMANPEAQKAMQLAGIEKT
ncbi:MAG TPA: glucoamylase family protein [Terracidiphilus sp.]|nr:glucoamylase family protein [Terracidiphilus sp.]